MVEYLRTFAYERLGWNRVASNLVFPDMAVLFRREHLLAAGGFRPEMETPGTDMIMRMQRHLGNVGIDGVFLTLPDLVAWITSPDEMVLRRRGRAKRQRGLLRVLWDHRRQTLNPEYGAFGMVALPYYWLAWIVAPFLELLGDAGVIFGWVTGLLAHDLIWAYLAAVLGYGMLLSVWTVVLEALTVRRYARRADLARLLLYALAEPFGPRQLVAWYRVRAFFTDRSLRQSHGHNAFTRSA